MKTLLTSIAGLAMLAAATNACSQQAAPVQGAYVCPVKRMAPKDVDQPMALSVLDQLNRAFDAALGPNSRHVYDEKAIRERASAKVDEVQMARLANVSGCAALIDIHGSCASFFDPELGEPLSIIMRMKKSAPVRRQFEAAISRLPDREARRAAQQCIKLVGTP